MPTGSSKRPRPAAQVPPAATDRHDALPAKGGVGRHIGLPGWQICLIGNLCVLAAATWSAATTGSVGPIAGCTLVATTILAAIITRRGDLPLVIMYPPLAFTTSTFVAGQLLVDPDRSWPVGQSLMLLGALGSNAAWVVGATGAALVLVGLRTWLRTVHKPSIGGAVDAASATNAGSLSAGSLSSGSLSAGSLNTGSHRVEQGPAGKGVGRKVTSGQEAGNRGVGRHVVNKQVSNTQVVSEQGVNQQGVNKQGSDRNPDDSTVPLDWRIRAQA